MKHQTLNYVLHGIESSRSGFSPHGDSNIAELKAHGDSVQDFEWRPQDIAIDGDRVAARLYDKGTHTKEWFGVAPTGKTFEFAEYSFHKVRDGRFYEMNYLIDSQAVRDQLDV